VQRFKKWFWSIIEKMSPSERQDLVSRTMSPCCPIAWLFDLWVLSLVITLLFCLNTIRYVTVEYINVRLKADE